MQVNTFLAHGRLAMRAKLKISKDGFEYKGSDEYLPVVLKHSHLIKQAESKSSIREALIIVSPVLLIILCTTFLASKNLDKYNYETGATTEQTR